MKAILGKLRKVLRIRSEQPLPKAAIRQAAIDRAGLPPIEPSEQAALDAAILWLCKAQDSSTSADGGVARAYSLKTGWQSSYPETTGYIIPTFLDCAAEFTAQDLRERARRMLDWLVRIQMPSGAFQGGRIDSHPVLPVVFNTGQILLGLAAGVHAFGNYRPAVRAAADWLVQMQDKDGCWRRGASPFAGPGEKAYDTHVAWGLIEAARVIPERGYEEAALANVRWAMTRQRSNGWLDNCCLSNFDRPLTHTLGYALRGIWVAYRYCGERLYFDSARRLADGLKSALREDGFLPGCLSADWSAAAEWVCLTGSVQIAYCWLGLFQETGDAAYRDAAFAANRYVRRTLQLSGAPEICGAVRGSFPIDGAYSQYEYPNWAAKFLIDSLVFERRVRKRAVAAEV